LNPYKRSSCGVCDTRAPISSFEDLNDADDGYNGELENQVGSVFLPLQRCKRKRVEEEDPVEVAKDSGTLNVFRGVKVTDKKITLSGSF
jgi:tyrosyl-DNA phosphodiesterase 2